MKKVNTMLLVLSAMFIAMGLALPTVFHSFGMAGSVFLPMHIPVLLCGLICGWKYGLVVGAIIPILSSITTGMPPIYPVAIFMAAETATYGAVSGFMMQKFNVVISLVIAMVAGRISLGIAQFILIGASGNLTFQSFLAGAVVTAVPGIVLQIILIPIIVMLLKKSGVLNRIA
ncbi:MAG: ECF transporter S component [Epulopiscium sp. Nele67-Bin005]|nr:MAG: ECF transporter S component [Epulopiscium sp. Nele67-Bin005]